MLLRFAYSSLEQALAFQERHATELVEAQRQQLEGQGKAINNLLARREKVRQRRRSVLREMEEVERHEADLNQRKVELLAEKERRREEKRREEKRREEKRREEEREQQQLKMEIRFHAEEKRRKKLELAMRKQQPSFPPAQYRENPEQFQHQYGAASTSDFTSLSGIEPLRRTRVSEVQTPGKSPSLHPRLVQMIT